MIPILISVITTYSTRIEWKDTRCAASCRHYERNDQRTYFNQRIFLSITRTHRWKISRICFENRIPHVRTCLTVYTWMIFINFDWNNSNETYLYILLVIRAEQLLQQYSSTISLPMQEVECWNWEQSIEMHLVFKYPRNSLSLCFSPSLSKCIIKKILFFFIVYFPLFLFEALDFSLKEIKSKWLHGTTAVHFFQ